MNRPYNGYLRALHVGASCTRPIMGVRPDAPTIETIVPMAFYEIIILAALQKVQLSTIPGS
jgi:hypothetical protein